MTVSAGDNSKGQLKSIVERIETVETEMREQAEGRKEIYLEAKSAGFDVPSIRAIVRMRREDAAKRAEREAMIELYKDTLGIL
jgi:uncharacterized protein (UPF0335 family)